MTVVLRCPRCHGQLSIETVSDDSGRTHMQISCLSCDEIVASTLPRWTKPRHHPRHNAPHLERVR